MMMMMMTSLKSGEYGFVLDPGGKMLDRMGDKLGVAFYKVEVRALQAMAIRYLQDESPSKIDLLSAELRLEKLRTEASQFMAVARGQCEGNEQRIKRLGQFERMLR
jgi:hypothetical protein